MSLGCVAMQALLTPTTACWRLTPLIAPQPEPGSRFHHTIGVGPLATDDDTAVVALDPPKTIILSAGSGPAGRARGVLPQRQREPGRTRVTMHETAERGAAMKVLATLGDAGLRLRNFASLERLKEIAEAEAG